jgi:hypothetical protein
MVGEAMEPRTPREQSEHISDAAEQTDATPTTRPMTNDDFLVPGPTPESNAGLARWGLTWILFSVLLMGMMLLMSLMCFGLAKLVGVA